MSDTRRPEVQAASPFSVWFGLGFWIVCAVKVALIIVYYFLFLLLYIIQTPRVISHRDLTEAGLILQSVEGTTVTL